MPVVAVNQSLADLLTWMLKSTIAGVSDLVFTLWVNDIEPDQATVFADLVRATFVGFQERWLYRSDWLTPSIEADHAVTTYGVSPLAFVCTAGPQTVYGWAAYNPDSLALVFVERFDAARDVSVGSTLSVLPRITLTTELFE